MCISPGTNDEMTLLDESYFSAQNWLQKQYF